MIGVLAAFPFLFSAHWLVNIGVFTLMYAVLATAWNLIGGYAGYISLGHVAFFGGGAYAIAVTTTHHYAAHGYEPFYVLPLVGAAVALGSLPLGWLAFRTRTATFAIVTLTLLFVFQQLAFNLRSLTGGSSGLLLPLPLFPVATYERPFYYALLGLLTCGLAISWWVRGSKLGLTLFAVRDDEDRARGLGMRVTYAKLAAFALSAGFFAMAGGVWAFYIGSVYPQFAIDPLVTIGAVLMVYLGGKATLWGPVLGAVLLVPAQQYLAYRLGASQLYLVGYAAVFLVVMLLLPRGILPSLAEKIRRRRGRADPGRPPAQVERPAKELVRS
ncbi:MAG: branched-chain amino acid ABC transporter permease [Actinobacteria bacterium]|nr:MAG: branched-chain amino acid ABC transporter permease [Actinomycetota bacterium]TMM25055.1 MAG: branched-chain amino acid ABC transporter permease [Actinomycetota bacterium]